MSPSHSPTRYTTSRTLVRRLCRLPGEDRDDFRDKVQLLRTHFERDNADTAELCQWFMGLRKQFGSGDDPTSFGVLGDFLLEPRVGGLPDRDDADENERDRWRRDVFDRVAGFGPASDRPLTLGDRPHPHPHPHTHPIPERLTNAIEQAASALHAPANTTAARLFARLGALHPSHRLVLCKSAAEWIVARYQRGMENWVRQHDEWQQERDEWEKAHPALTPELRDRFTGVFKRLRVNKDETEAVAQDDTETPSKTGLRRKNPRICRYERLRLNIDNCCYAGQKGHRQQCWEFREFVKQCRSQNTKFNPGFFAETAQSLLTYCRESGYRSPSRVLGSHNIPDVLFAHKPHQARQHLHKQFKPSWHKYIELVEDNEETSAEIGCLRHCRKMSGKKGLKLYEDSECRHNPHTDLCKQYHRLLTAEFVAEIARDADAFEKLEGLYREWRRFYLGGPRKPQFQYPSARDMPMPKVFGAGFFEVDMERSVLRLRLENMQAGGAGGAGGGGGGGEWLEVGFIPWPSDYSPSRAEAADRVTSIHVQFASPSRVRLGFHFRVEHAVSRFTCTQDELDTLRSRVYPRQAQDKAFLKAARDRLDETFAAGDPDKTLRILTVDMGMNGAHAAVFEGKTFKSDQPIKINKGKDLYVTFPDKDKDKSKDKSKDPHKGDTKGNPAETPGLRREHVGRHLTTIAEGAGSVATRRLKEAGHKKASVVQVRQAGVPRASDFRGLKRHIAWMVRDWARLNASQIVKAATKHNCDLIVFESLRGKPPADYNKLGTDDDRKKSERVLYAYGQVRQKVKEKAVERGMRVVTVPYFKSSQVCASCGRPIENKGPCKKNKHNKKFLCEHKGCKAHKTAVDSDANAARVLGRVFWGEIVLPDPE